MRLSRRQKPIVIVTDQAPRHYVNTDDAEYLIRRQKEVATALFDKGSTYTTIVVVAGYAAFFGIWDKVAEFLTSQNNLHIAIAIGASVLLFIVFEVFKMALYSVSMLGLTRALTQQTPQQQIAQMLTNELRDNKVQHVATIVWIGVLAGVCATAIYAVGAMIYGVVSLI